MVITILDSHSIPTLFQSFGLSPSYTHLPCLATALAVIPAPTVGARHALCFLTFFFLAPSFPLSRTCTLFLWHLSSPHSCAPTTLLRPPSLSVFVLLSLVLCTHILSSPTLLLRAPPGCHGDPTASSSWGSKVICCSPHGSIVLDSLWFTSLSVDHSGPVTHINHWDSSA